MVRIDDVAAIGYQRGAEAYERGRPGYAHATLARVGALTGDVGGSAVIELGAGTGKLTRLIGAAGAGVVALEPVPAMAAFLPAVAPKAATVRGVAEALPFRDGSVEVAWAAAAIHWFELDMALDELARVLAPTAWFVVVRNDRDRSVPWVAELEALLDEYRGPVRSERTVPWRRALSDHPAFGLVERFEDPHVVHTDIAGLVDRVRSLSYVACLPQVSQAHLESEVRALCSGLPDRFPLPHTTRARVYRRND